METINVTIEDGNVDIKVACEPDNFMSATSVMFAYMVQNSSNTFEELLEILRGTALEVVEKNTLKISEEEGDKDEVQ